MANARMRRWTPGSYNDARPQDHQGQAALAVHGLEQRLANRFGAGIVAAPRGRGIDRGAVVYYIAGIIRRVRRDRACVDESLDPRGKGRRGEHACGCNITIHILLPTLALALGEVIDDFYALECTRRAFLVPVRPSH